MNSAMTRRPDGPPDPSAPRRSRIPRLSDQAGFGLVEAIASAAVLAILALGVLAGVDGAASSTGREKARAVAGALAEQDQERMHAMRAADLPDHRRTWKTNVAGIDYTVVSEVDWVSDVTGAEVSCTSNGGKADFMRLRTTVTSATVGTSTAPVRIDSLLAPQIGSAGGSNGTLSVQVVDRDGLPSVGRSIKVTGNVAGHVESKLTNAKGCAIFANIPADTYAVTMNETPYVTTEGVQAVSSSGTVSPGATAIMPLRYDLRGALSVSFQTQYVDWSAGKVLKLAPSRGWSVSLTNAGMSTNLGRRTLVDAGGVPQASFAVTTLFPFSDGYGVHPGRCTDEAPSGFDATWAQTAGNAFINVDRNANLSMTVRQPALPVRIANGTYGSNPQKGKPNWVGGANVQARLVTAATSDCLASPETLKGRSQDNANGLQSYPDGQNFSGTLSATSNYDTGFKGFVTKRAPGTAGQTWNDGYFDPGLPWGTWQVCADSGGRRNFATIVNKQPNGTASYAIIDLQGAGSTSNTCNGGTAWPAPVLPGVAP